MEGLIAPEYPMPALGEAVPLARDDPNELYWFQRYARSAEWEDTELHNLFRMTRDDSVGLPLSLDLSNQAAPSYTAYVMASTSAANQA